MYNNGLLKTVQKSKQGVYLENGVVISEIGQTDDIALLLNRIYNLTKIFNLALSFCTKYHKIKLLKVSTTTEHLVHCNPIRIVGENIEFSDEAEHVGIIQSSFGNIPNILSRFTAHR